MRVGVAVGVSIASSFMALLVRLNAVGMRVTAVGVTTVRVSVLVEEKETDNVGGQPKGADDDDESRIADLYGSDGR